jgi:hypothetical protein
MDALAAWILLPIAVAACSWGVGLLAERVLRTELDGGLVFPLGFAIALVLLSVPYTLGFGATPSTALFALPVVAGFVLGRARLRASLPPAPVALATLGTYLLYIAPVALTGTATFAGYTFLGDNSVHFSLVDHVARNGVPMGDLPYSSYGAVLQLNLGNGYPLTRRPPPPACCASPRSARARPRPARSSRCRPTCPSRTASRAARRS